MRHKPRARPAWRDRLETYLIHAWQRRGALPWTLRPLSWLFGACMAARRAAFALGWLRRTRLAVPVVIVGNVTVGGTGKTPTVIALVEALRAQGYTPGVISRGYGARIKAPRPVVSETCVTAGGDEPLLIARACHAPVWVSPDRVDAARALLRAHPEVNLIISDDGLQHYALARDLELVVFDHRLGGNGWLLPAGPLREPLRRKRDASLINSPREPLPPWPNTFRLTLAPRHAWQVAEPARRKPLARFAGQRLLAAAGIGAPERFFATLRAAGLEPATLPLPDHFDFRDNPFVEVQADAILITEKDAVKCLGWRDARLWAVPVEAALDLGLIAIILEKLRGRTLA